MSIRELGFASAAVIPRAAEAAGFCRTKTLQDSVIPCTGFVIRILQLGRQKSTARFCN